MNEQICVMQAVWRVHGVATRLHFERNCNQLVCARLLEIETEPISKHVHSQGILVVVRSVGTVFRQHVAGSMS